VEDVRHRESGVAENAEQIAVPGKLSLRSFLETLYNSLTGQKNRKFIKHN
jgi:hypothetical protein